jgi:hypothetical protein
MENENSSKMRSQILSIYKSHAGKEKLDYMSNTILEGKVTGYDAIGGMGSFTGLLKEQDIETQEKYLPTFVKLSESGGAYVQAVLGMNVMLLKRSADERVSKLNTELKQLEKEGSEEKAVAKRLEHEKAADFAEKVTSLLNELK